MVSPSAAATFLASGSFRRPFLSKRSNYLTTVYCQPPIAHGEDKRMKTATIALTLLLSAPAYAQSANCTRFTPSGPVGFTNLRSGPGVDFGIQHQVSSQEGALLWCGKSVSSDVDPTTSWLYVAYQVEGSSKWYYGWISRKVVVPFEGTRTARGTLTQDFLEGRSAYPGR